MDTKHLTQNDDGLWLFNRRVPVKLKQFYPKGQRFIKQSLETHSLTQARVKRDALNAEIELRLQEAKSSLSSKSRFNALYTDLKGKQRIEDKRAADEDEESMFSYAYDPDNKPVRGDKTYEDAFYAVLRGEVPERYKLSISELFDEWLKANDEKKPEKYKSTVRTAKAKLIEFLEGDEPPSNVSPGMAQRFVDQLLDEGRTAATVTHYKSKIAEVWSWGVSREKFEGGNVWKDVRIEATQAQKEQDHFRNLSYDEAKQLLKATTIEASSSDSWPYPFGTYALPRLLPFLGLRRGELAGARKEQLKKVDERLFFEVWKGKTKNAERIVPVSPLVAPLLNEVVENAGESPYLFPEFMEAKIGSAEAMNSLSSRISKVTSNFEKVEGYKTSLHSLRGHFATALEEIGCPEEIAVKLVGHKRLSLTYGLYSKYKNKDKLWGYIDKIHRADCLKAWL